MQEQAHWDEVYRTRQSTAVSWYQPSPEPSLRALDQLPVPDAAALIDVGGGASNLVDRLVGRGWSDLTVLDIAAPSLQVAKGRLGASADRVHWIVADITAWLPGRTYQVWHDRAVFHFLTTHEAQEAYRRALLAGTRTGSFVIIATFAPDGPERCSGLPVQRYDPPGLAGRLGPQFSLVHHWREEHTTPGGNPQAFNWCVFQRV